MNRQSVIVIITGAIASLSGFWTFDHFRGRRCAELGGTWTSTTRQCQLPGGESVGATTAFAALAGLAVALLVGFTLYRAYLYATGRAQAVNTR
jgi:hypothetical protein